MHREDLDFGRAFAAAANHTGFAFGRHFCVGAMLSKVEVETGVNTLLDAIDGIELTAPVHAEGIFTRAPVSLPVRFRRAT